MKLIVKIQLVTPGTRISISNPLLSAMPEFYEKMKDNLRTAEQGGDCITWLVACDKEALGSSGGFYQDRQEVV